MNRILLHGAFWLGYLFIMVFTDYYLINYSYFNLPNPDRLLKNMLPQLILLPLKMSVTYYAMYRGLPLLLRKQHIVRVIVEFLALMTIVLVLYQWLLVNVIYPLSNNDELPISHSFTELLSRIFWRSLAIFSVAAIACTFQLFRLRLRDAEKEKVLVREKLESELNFLRSQLNPHFLFNTLNNIYVLARKKSDQTADAVMQLSKMMRFMLYESQNNQIPLSQEIKVIEDYVALERMRYNDRLHIHFKKQYDTDELIAPLLLLPFVENAFKHGSNHGGQIAIDIAIRLSDKNLFFSVENSTDNEFTENEEGIGLQNTRRQLELLYKDYRFEKTHKGNRYTVNLAINLSHEQHT